MPDNTVIDSSRLTSLHGFTDYNDYNTWYQTHEDERPYALCVVGNGNTLDNNDLYYGNKRFTDVNVVSSKPEGSNYPDDKIYLVPITIPSTETIIGYNLYFKHDGIVSGIDQSPIASVEYDDDTTDVIIYFRIDNTGGVIPVTLTSGTVNNVLQSSNSTNGNYPLLFKNSTSTSNETGEVHFNSNIKVNPSTGEVSATKFSGNGTKLTGLSRLMLFRCNTSGSTADKVTATTSLGDGLTLSNSDLVNGLTVLVQFQQTNSSTGNLTLKVSNCDVLPLFLSGSLVEEDVSYATGSNLWRIGEIVQVTYSNQIITGTGNSTPAWVIVGEDNMVQQESKTNNSDYPILFRSRTGVTPGLGEVSFGGNNDVTINPSTGTLKAKTITADNYVLTASTHTAEYGNLKIVWSQSGKIVTGEIYGSNLPQGTATDYTYSSGDQLPNDYHTSSSPTYYRIIPLTDGQYATGDFLYIVTTSNNIIKFHSESLTGTSAKYGTFTYICS